MPAADTRDTMKEQRLTFPGSNGDQLSARLGLPADGEVQATALFAHCFTCSKDLRAAVNISRALNQAGIAVLRFDFTGLGESEGDFADTTFSSNIEDLIAAANSLAEELEAPSILVGHSLGGAAVLQAAGRIPSVKAVATIGAPADPGHVTHLFDASLETIDREGSAEIVLAGRPFTVKREFVRDLAAHRMEEAVGSLGRALLILHSPVDRIVGVENAAQLYKAARHPKSFVSLDDADHLLLDPADSLYVGTVLAAWASRYIGIRAEREATEAQLESDGRIASRTESGAFRTEILARGHALVADEPTAVGGEDLGPTPYDLLASGLAACTSITLRIYADRKSWPLETATVRVRHRRIHARDGERCEGEDARLDKMDREVVLSGELSQEQRQRLLEIADRCPVHRTLDAGVQIITTGDTAE
jgi:putative redox protein